MGNVLLDVVRSRLLDVPCFDVSFVQTEGQLGQWSIKGQSHLPVPQVRYARNVFLGKIPLGQEPVSEAEIGYVSEN
jgi:hypothetical protein